MMNIRLLATISILSVCACGSSPTDPKKPEGDKLPVEVMAKETPTSAWQTYQALTVDRIPDFTPGKKPSLDIYGGLNSHSYEATGWFRVEKIGNRWWIIDPLGHPFIGASVGEFGVGGSERQQQALSTTFGTTPRWAASEMAWIKSIGFTALGRGNSATVVTIPSRIPYCVYSGPMTSYTRYLKSDLKYNIPTNLPVVFDEGYDEYLSQLSWLTKYADDPYCLGIFADNELYWTDDILMIYLERFPADNKNRKTAQSWLDARKGHSGCTIADASVEDKEAFKAYCLDSYLKRTLAAIRTYDRNHMFIGSRFYKWAWELSSEAMMHVAGQYMDIISINHYTKWEPDPEDFRKWESWSGRPLLISEFYVKGEDSGLPNNSGLGWVVPTQEDRGLFYENFTIGLIRTGCCVAWQWFKYMDNDPEDTTADASNTDSNKGLVCWDFSRYDALISHMEALNNQIYNLADFY